MSILSLNLKKSIQSLCSIARRFADNAPSLPAILSDDLEVFSLKTAMGFHAEKT